MDSKKLKEHVDIVLEKAKEELVRRGKVKPEALLIREDDSSVFPLTFSNLLSKRRQQMLLKRKVQTDPTIQAVIIKVEAWVKEVPHGDKVQFDKVAKEGAEAQPDRTEALVINGTSKDYTVHIMQPFKKDTEKKVVLGTIIESLEAQASALTEGMWTRSLQDILDNYTLYENNVKW
jgi:hypothetical protein